tara:strand:- start:9870 stop:10589 length:720 start_codon:yes stop_codon:yes gene_type:complete
LSDTYKNEAICNEIDNNKAKSSCFLEKAIKTNNSKLCSEIPNKETKVACYYEVGKKTKNLTLCELGRNLDSSFSMHKESCYSAVAIYLNDPTICSKLDDEVEIFFCYGQVGEKTLNLSVCDMSKDIETGKAYKSSCYDTVGSKSPEYNYNITFCDEIAEKNYRDLCYTRIAYIIMNVDEQFCDRIEYYYRRQDCLSYSNALYKKECDNIEEFDFDNYYYTYQHYDQNGERRTTCYKFAK